MSRTNKPLTQQLIALKTNQTRTNSKRRLLKKKRHQIHSLELVSIVMKKDTKSEYPKKKRRNHSVKLNFMDTIDLPGDIGMKSIPGPRMLSAPGALGARLCPYIYLDSGAETNLVTEDFVEV